MGRRCWEAKKKILDGKVKKFKMKRDILEEATEDMRSELYQYMVQCASVQEGKCHTPNLCLGG